LISKKTLKVESLKNLRSSIFDLLQNFIANDETIDKKLLELPEDQLIISFRKRFPTQFGVFYDILQTSGFCMAFCTSKNILEFVGSILDTNANNLAWAGMLLRIDVPHDKRNTINWHQDHTYLPFGGTCGKSLVLIIPLQDTYSSMGAVNIIPESHKHGVKQYLKANESKSLSSEQKTVEVSEVEKVKSIVPELMLGDVLLMDMNLLHASGFNISDRVRFSLLIRFFDNIDPAFKRFKTTHALI